VPKATPPRLCTTYGNICSCGFAGAPPSASYGSWCGKLRTAYHGNRNCHIFFVSCCPSVHSEFVSWKFAHTLSEGIYIHSVVVSSLCCRCAIKSRTIITAVETSEEFKVPRCKPPLSSGLVKKSPNVAPNGRVKTKATQNKMM
jgi:hypothetical protein